jgi:uncharacterized protein YhjY with autotransporter beta-barrel domain
MTNLHQWIAERNLMKFVVLALTISSPLAYGQTLDQQYDYYLDAKCRNLGFERNVLSFMLPGQAGPNLFAFCNGPIPLDEPAPGVSIAINAVGGAAGAGAGRVNQDDGAALRRRQQQLRDDKGEVTPDNRTDFSLLAEGNFAAFVAIDLQRQRQKDTHFESGKSADRSGAMLGADYRFGATAVLGLAVTHHELSGDFSGGGRFTQKSQGVLLYGSWFPTDGLFIDASLGMENLDQHTRRLVGRRVVVTTPTTTTVTFDPPLSAADSNANSRNISSSLRGGYDFLVGAVTLGPRIGLARHKITLDGFAETGATPMTLRFDQQTEKSLQSSLGIYANRVYGLPAGVLSVQLNADWLHEFADDQRVLTASFAEDLRPDPVQLRFLNQAPDRDWFNVRVGAVAVFPRGLNAFLALESTFGHDYLDRYGASIGLRQEF